MTGALGWQQGTVGTIEALKISVKVSEYQSNTSSAHFVIPVKTGIHGSLKRMDSRLQSANSRCFKHGNDGFDTLIL